MLEDEVKVDVAVSEGGVNIQPGAKVGALISPEVQNDEKEGLKVVSELIKQSVSSSTVLNLPNSDQKVIELLGQMKQELEKLSGNEQGKWSRVFTQYQNSWAYYKQVEQQYSTVANATVHTDKYIEKMVKSLEEDVKALRANLAANELD
jgi:hypothetical protein